MADNLDDLLDDVEAKFCRDISVSSKRACSFKADQVKQTQHRYKDSGHSTSDLYKAEDITYHVEDVLQEILCDDDQATGSHLPSSSKTYKGSFPQTALKKCCPVYLGGSSARIGIATSITQRACDQIRCTSCDFSVVMFDDFEWDPSCDYLFFRNSMPDYSKLQAKLKRRQGARAYACQCSWHSALTPSDLRDIQQLKWVCGLHNV